MTVAQTFLRRYLDPSAVTGGFFFCGMAHRGSMQGFMHFEIDFTAARELDKEIDRAYNGS